MSAEATKYFQYARECLRQAEEAEQPELREKLVELSRVWMHAAITEDMHSRTGAQHDEKAPGG